MDFKVLVKHCLFLSLAIGLLLAGCGGKGVKPTGGDPETLYREGLVRFNKRDYSEALKRFQELKANFPDHPPYTLWAEVKVGDCHFFKEEYVEAIAAYEEFKKMHPTHEEMPYVQYQIGMSHFKQMLSLDRDQTATKKALSNFEYLVANFPPSLFTEKAKEKIEICKKRLADHEFYVASYYYRKKNYGAASRRFQQLLVNFPRMANEDEALLLLGKSYLELNEEVKAREVLGRVVDEYPQRSSSKEAESLLRKSKDEKNDHDQEKDPPEHAPDVFPFTKYLEERRKSIGLQSPLTLPVRKINPHPRVEMELEFTPEEEKRILLSPISADREEEKGKRKQGISTGLGEAKWVGQREPIDITSDEVETYARENRVIFRGSVIARQRDIAIYADSIEAILMKEGKGIERVIASGNVKVQQGSRVAHCQRAVFQNPEQSVLLTGDPEVWEGENRVSGEAIVFDIGRNRVEVKGGVNRRGKAKIYPEREFEKLK
ncbi:MAG: outer membrane protein assembly factor BamD [Thermodesulfobacteriota bacterium]